MDMVNETSQVDLFGQLLNSIAKTLLQFAAQLVLGGQQIQMI